MRTNVIFRCIILMCFIHSNSGWIRFRYPMSRRNYLQQTAREMLQNCGGNPEELCGVCGEGPNELPTELISTKDFQLVNTSEGPLEIRLGFRMNMQGYFEMRLCKLGPDSLVNADYCRNMAPLKLYDDYRYIPGNEQNSVRLQITLPPEVACERCVLQVKYVPGAGSRVADQLFFDCALLRIPQSRENLKLSGRIIMSTDKPLNTSPFSPPFSTTQSSIASSTSMKMPGTTTTSSTRFTDLPSSTLSTGVTFQSDKMLTRVTQTLNIPRNSGFPTNTFPSSGKSSISSIYLNKPFPTLSNSGKFITLITKPISSTSSDNLNRRFGTIGNSMNFRNIINSNTRTSGTLDIRNRPVVGLEQLGPVTVDPFIEPQTTDIPLTTIKSGMDMNQTIIINETSTNTRGSVIISVNNVTDRYRNISDIFDANRTEVISIQNDTSITSGKTSFTLSTAGVFNDTSAFNQTESNITLTEIPLPGDTSTKSLNENLTKTQNVTEIPARTVIGNYDTYDYNNTYTDYYYDYFTYSDIPGEKNKTSNETYIANKNDTVLNLNESTTYINLLNDTVSTDLYPNDSFTNLTTTETRTAPIQNNTAVDVTRMDVSFNATETTEQYIFYYDYDTVTNASSVLDNSTQVVNEMNNTTSVSNGTFTIDTITTTDFQINATEIPLFETTNTPINDTNQTTIIMPEMNVPLTEIPFNISGSTDSQINATSQVVSTVEPNQKIVVVSDSLFDRVLFPTPKPNQRVVEVPNVITIFPTKDSMFPATTTPSQMTTMSTQTSRQTTSVTDVITPRVTPQQTEIIIETTNTTDPSPSIPTVNITEIDYINKTEIVVDPYTVTTTEPIVTTTDVSFTQPISDIVSTIGPVFEPTSNQTDFITNITSGAIPFSTDGIQPTTTTTGTQTIIDTTKFDITSTFVSEIINANYTNSDTTPSLETSTIKGGYQVIGTSDPGPSIPEVKSITSPTFSGQTEKNLGIDMILDSQTKPAELRPNWDNSKIVDDPITRPRTTPSSTFGQFQGGITYMPEADGQTDTRGGIPIQRGMFIDLFIPKFNPDSKDSIFLQQINSSKILADALSGDNQKATIKDVSQESSFSVFPEFPTRSRSTVMPESIPNQRGTSFGQFTRITGPTSKADDTRRRFNVNNGMFDQVSFANRESNFTPVQKIDNKLIDRSLNDQNIGSTSRIINSQMKKLPSSMRKGTSSVRKEKPRDLFFNLLESPEIMPPIFVPRGSRKSDKDNFVQQDRDNTNRVISSNTVWKGPGVAQGFGLFTGPVSIQGLDQNKEGNMKETNNFIGVTGPVYVPVNEISIPLDSPEVTKARRNKDIRVAENPVKNEINTTFSTLWDLNRLNRNKSQESGTFVNMDTSTDQIMPPYIGIPLVWSQENSASSTVERTTNPSERNWNDLPVPDIMPPIKVRLLNMTSKGTFVDNNSMLNQTDDVNKRILQKLEAIVGELQRNRAILTQTLEVNPAYEQGFQLSFDRFPGQLSRLTDSRNNQLGMNTPRTNLLSETIQQPVMIQRIGSGENKAEIPSSSFGAFPQIVNDPRGNAPISEAHIGSMIGPHSFNLMNILGISDERPLKAGGTGIRIRINTSEIDNEPLPTKSPNADQTVIDTDFMTNNTLTMLSNTLKAVLSNQSVENITLWDEIAPSEPMLRTENRTTVDTLILDTNTTDPYIGPINTTEQTIVDVKNISKMFQALTGESNNLPKVTRNNQLVISPTVSELLNPFLGTNISLENRTESTDHNTTSLNEKTELKAEVDTTLVSAANTSTTSGQTVISGLETVAMIKELNNRKVNQRNMTDKERVRDKFVRLTFNNRVKGIRHHPAKRISIEGKYYVGKMGKNSLGEFEPIPVHSGVILHEVSPTKTTEPIENQPDIPIVQLSEFNIPSSMNKPMEVNGGIMGSSSGTKGQIVEIQALPVQSDVPSRNFDDHIQIRRTQEVMESRKVKEKATPIITKQFFDGSDILMARSDSANTRDRGLQVLQNVNQQFDNKYVPNGFEHSVASNIEQSNAINDYNRQNIKDQEIDLFSGKFRQRLPNSLSLSPVAPSNMCADGQLFVCKAIGDYSMVPGMRWWCFSHCRLGDCPDKKCKCTCEDNQSYTVRSKTSKNLEKKLPVVDTVQTAEFSNGQNMFREKTIINLTLNGSETSKVALPIETQVTQNAIGNKMGTLIITKYGTSDSVNTKRDSRNGHSEISASSLSNTLRISPITSVDNVPPPDSMAIRRPVSTTVKVISKRDSLKCKGINAFAGKPEIDRWCTINCSRNVCPPELCVC